MSDPLARKELRRLINADRIRKCQPPLGLTIQITLNIGCNADCAMCGGRKYDPKKKFAYRAVRRIITLLDRRYVKEVRLMGGEPLLDTRGFFNTMKDCEKKGLALKVFTNGFYLDRAFIDRLKKFPNTCVTFSLHAMREHHDHITGLPGHFAKIENALRLADRHGLSARFSATTVLMRTNKSQIIPLKRFLSKLHIPRWSLIELENLGKDTRQLRLDKRTLRQMKEKMKRSRDKIAWRFLKCSEASPWHNRCAFLLEQLNLRDDGKIVPCRQNDNNPFRMTRPVEQLYRNENFSRYLLEKIGACRQCFRNDKKGVDS